MEETRVVCPVSTDFSDYRSTIERDLEQLTRNQLEFQTSHTLLRERTARIEEKIHQGQVHRSRVDNLVEHLFKAGVTALLGYIVWSMQGV